MRAWQGYRGVLLAVGFGMFLCVCAEGISRFFPSKLPDAGDLFDVWQNNDWDIFVPKAGTLRATHPDLVRIDNPPVEFSAAPEKNAFRVFCLGGSTTVGWPYHPRGGYPRWLRLYLDDLLPADQAHRVEIINAGVMAFDTRRCLGVLKEILPYQPDLVIIFTGYNDNHLHGAASLKERLMRWMQRAHFWLVRYSRFYNLMRRVFWGAGVDKLPNQPGRQLSDSELRQLILEYENDVVRMIRMAQAANSRVLLMDLPYSTSSQWGADHAARYQRMNQMLLKISRQERVPLVDLSELTQKALFVDEGHADLHGYGLMGLKAARGVAQQGWILDPNLWNWKRLSSFSAYQKRLGLLDPDCLARLDVRLGLYYAQKGKNEWAQDYFAQALRLSPHPDFVFNELDRLKDSRPFFILALACEQLGHLKESLQARAKAQSLQADNELK